MCGSAIAYQTSPLQITPGSMRLSGDIKQLKSNGRSIQRRHGCLTLGDGTLAGADLDPTKAVRHMIEIAGLSLDEALSMETMSPATLKHRQSSLGTLIPGAMANFVLLSDENELVDVWALGIRHNAD